MFTLEETLDITIQKGTKKVHRPFVTKCIFSFIGGAMIALGYLAAIRVTSVISAEWSSFASLIGAAIFPIGLIAILLGGGELVTGNMMVVSVAWFAKKISFKDLVINLVTITIGNFIGALFVAYFFGHITGLTTSGPYLEQTLSAAAGKIDTTMLQAFISGIGCNWFVGLSVWLCYGTKSPAAKYIGIWFPVTTFVAIGFQHSVANIFIISASIFEGFASWNELFINFIPVYMGNLVGGALIVGGLYYLALKKD